MSLFEKDKGEFYKQIKAEADTIPSYFEGFILKGDVSGIQDFIFNIKSRGAAKTLKSRSFFVQIMTLICLEKIKKELGLLNEENGKNKDGVIDIDGGGNFFLFIPTEKFDEDKWEKEIVKKVQEELQYEEIYLVLAYEEITKEEAQKENIVVEKIDFINQKTLNLSRYRKNDLLEDKIFKPYTENDILHFEQKTIKVFTKELTESTGYQIIDRIKDPEEEEKKKYKNAIKCFDAKRGKRAYISLFDYTFDFNKKSNELKNGAINKLPKWRKELFEAYEEDLEKIYQERLAQAITEEDKKEISKTKECDIIEFDFMAMLAKERTGTEKLAILKLDIDNLGTAFQEKNLKKIKFLSSSLNRFFNEFLWILLNKHFKTQTREKEQKEIDLSYKDVIYNIYAGGDDCFLVGAWDAIFEFTQLLQTEFTAFAKSLTERKELELKQKLTISAGIVVVHAKFPVIRFAELAEEALSEAKKHKVGNLQKNAISVFGEVISWHEFEEVAKIKTILIDLAEILKESNSIRSLLERIKNSIVGYESLQEKIKNGKVSIKSVWRFNYYLRYIRSNNLKGEDKQKVTELTDKLVECYQRYLINAISKEQYTRAAIFPIAARWTEFLTRKKLEQL